ncbi:cathepsin l [Stylonychia lemnae]|uniref:Cathepsin l n=1 Tax=Stylonychia lemnae TaxID=5949 RepID=A0A078A3V7_STYLE|nr:cathepsin l [Stylonychia lemnae]|eukprot:CDW75439.1 cathepsin l [Stylonychia lemnae]
MRQSLSITIAVVGVVAALAVFTINESARSTQLYGTNYSNDNIVFANYLAKYGKSYATKEEYEFRLQQFQANLAKNAQHNSQNGVSYHLGINKFTDYSPAEYKRLLGFKKSSHSHSLQATLLQETNNTEGIDWRQKGAVTGVKNQGQCGSCWAFSSTGALEGHFFLSDGKLVSLSEQQLVDCSHNGNNGCNGGEMYLAFDYATKSPLETEADYPYLAADEKCSYIASKGVVRAANFQRVEANSAAQLKTAINQGPVSVAIEADQYVFQGYQSGILDSTACGTQLDHGVLAVGYGSENGKEYYIVKNSWGTSWGENGFVRIAIVDGEGICGIQKDAVYPFTVRA